MSENSWLKPGDFEQQPPTKIGWYALLICYEPEEGILDEVRYWNGARWDVDNPYYVDRSKEPFNNRSTAEMWAELNNPDNT